MGPSPCLLGPQGWGLVPGTVPRAATTAILVEGLHVPPGRQVARETQQLCHGPGTTPLRPHHQRACSALGVRTGLKSPMSVVRQTPIKKFANKVSQEPTVIPAGNTPPFFLPQDTASTQTWLLPKPADGSGGRGRPPGHGPGRRSSGTTATAIAFLPDWLHPSRKWPRKGGPGQGTDPE